MSDSHKPEKTYQILEALGHQPKKKLGQNFLIDKNIVNKSLSLAHVLNTDIIVEIGPGLGTLTRTLLENASDVYAIEKDHTLYNYLKNNLLPEYPDKLHLMKGDALEYPTANLPTKHQAFFKIIANLPYAISTSWLDGVLSGPLPQSMTLMLQKEAADRFIAKPGTKTMGPISIFLNSAYEPKDSHRVSRRCFYPEPKIDSILLHLQEKDHPYIFQKKTKDLIRQFFTQRRKQIQALCKSKTSTNSLVDWLNYLDQESISQKSRPEVIPLSAWHMLDKLLSD